MGHRHVLAALVLVGTLAVGGCGSQRASDGVGSPSSPPGASTGATTAFCAAGWHPDAATLARLTAADEVVAVLRCRGGTEAVTGDGEWSVLVLERADTGLQPLLAGLREADEPTPADIACPVSYVLAPDLAVVRPDGRILPVGVPRTACGQPSQAVLAAQEALAFREVARTRVERLRTQAEVDLEAQATAVGCPTAFKDMIRIEAAGRALPRGPGGSPYASAPRSLSVCRFAGDPADAQVGRFVSGERLSAGTLAPVLEALGDTAPGQACTREHHGFVALLREQDYVLVETDGCRRVFADPVADAHEDYRTGQASPGLLALLG